MGHHAHARRPGWLQARARSTLLLHSLLLSPLLSLLLRPLRAEAVHEIDESRDKRLCLVDRNQWEPPTPRPTRLDRHIKRAWVRVDSHVHGSDISNLGSTKCESEVEGPSSASSSTLAIAATPVGDPRLAAPRGVEAGVAPVPTASGAIGAIG